MKINLSPELAYLVGLWKHRRTKNGLGIHGSEKLQEVFVAEAMKTLGISADKFQVGENEVFFYHSAYRKFFQDTVKRELEVFKWRNEYSASYLAGLFDSNGGVSETGKLFLARFSRSDTLILERLNFRVLKKSKMLFFANPMDFIGFVKPFIKHEEVKIMLEARKR